MVTSQRSYKTRKLDYIFQTSLSNFRLVSLCFTRSNTQPFLKQSF
ncbi:hypothetical protein VAE130_570355 [Vibrio aestuarianus]|nr:hypothetical protein VAE308_1050356 [Vibrio aestuarianus]CAH8195087.1 hypothetical protein VIBAE_A30949 [Vibrio aestuarianus subsp. francensis]CAH8195493.1 hypothetical protein VAE032_270352 [Vibrio aestuarianus]CAH8195561.1 hypothetical protein VAE128_460355 [Vibrio aestuarianus]CAH8195796.1 hypothetical protein VAE130_570355 [Vibrio aestuarianus]